MQRIKKKRYCKGHSTLTHARARPNRMKKTKPQEFPGTSPTKEYGTSRQKTKKIVNMHM